MKSKIRKISMFALIVGLLVTLAGQNIINAEEDVKEENIEENLDETNETNKIEEKENLEIIETSNIVSVEQQAVDSVSKARTVGLVPDITTLEEVFPDATFRTYVATTVLGISSYDDSTDSTSTLSSTDITAIANRMTITVNGKEIKSLEGIKYFTNLVALHCSSNEISELDVSMLVKLKILNCGGNKISNLNVSPLVNLETLTCGLNPLTELNVTGLTKLSFLSFHTSEISTIDLSGLINLTRVEAYRTPISELNIPEVAKPNITTLNYRSTNIKTLDLTNYTGLTGTLAVTKATNSNMSLLKGLYVTGSRNYQDVSMVRVSTNAGGVNWDAGTGYYVISSGYNATYGFTVAGQTATGMINVDNVQSLANGGLMDDEGNLVVGASLANVDSTGKITVSGGSTILTPGGTYVFEGETTLDKGIIETNDDYSFSKNTSTYDESTGSAIANISDITTNVSVGNGSASINTNNDSSTLPTDSVIINNVGDEIYPTGEAIVDSTGNVTSDDVIIAVPSDNTGNVTTDGSEITFPAGVTVDDGTTSITYPGNIIYDTEDNSIKYLPIDGLFNEDGTLKDGITQEDITNSKDFVSGLDDSALKTELQNKVEEAQKELDERNAQKAVDDLFDKEGNIKDTVTQDDIDNAQDLVDKVTDADKKAELQDKLDEAQKQLDEKNFVVLETFKVFTGTGTVYTKIDAPVEKFSKVYVDGKELDASNYEVTSGSTVITLNEAYLKTLANGTYDVDAEFSSGAVVETKLTVNVSNNPSTKPTEPTTPSTPPTSKPSVKPSVDGGSGVTNSSVKAGDETNTTLLFGMLVASFAVVGVYTRRKREVK